MPHASEEPNGTGTGRAGARGSRDVRRITIDGEGPLLVEGPVEVVADDGTVSVSDRFVVAVCTCRRSRTYPWCDTSHRRRRRPARPARREGPRRAAEGEGA
ncbi:CDGSH iron-sulfur domain-containing protein [Streptomyces sp. SPB074]|uniref:CDGSH iron-sulfur domain-containing protein n=1 Tax=Streptomyces sp. (strain SPB074) TaxID=465543 RepID=UPI00017F25EA|nr:zinc finger CDGSH type superfamily protein [Streptomyces sp. SPB074]